MIIVIYSAGFLVCFIITYGLLKRTGCDDVLEDASTTLGISLLWPVTVVLFMAYLLTKPLIFVSDKLWSSLFWERITEDVSILFKRENEN